MKPVMIRGAGMIGSLVADKLVQNKVPVVIVSRHPDRFAANPAFTILDRADKAAQIEVLKTAGAVVNLEGKSIAAGIWTGKVKNEIPRGSKCESALKSVPNAAFKFWVRNPVYLK